MIWYRIRALFFRLSLAFFWRSVGNHELYEFPRCGHSGVLRVMEKSWGRVHHRAAAQVRRDPRYIRDPDGYIIEVGQSTDLKYG
jgi:hypothetical protein